MSTAALRLSVPLCRRNLICVTLAYAAVTLVVSSAFGSDDSASRTALITTEGFSKLHRGPDRQSRVIALINQGTRCPVILETETWVKIRFEKVEGWVESSRIEIEPVPAGNPARNPQGVLAQSALEQMPQSAGVPKQSPNSASSPRLEQKSQKAAPRKFWKKVARSITPPMFRSNESAVIVSDHEESIGPVIRDIRVKNPLDIRILKPSLSVLSTVAPHAPVVGIARRGARYPLLRQNSTWVEIKFGDTTGWVERASVEILQPGQGSSRLQPGTIWALVCVFVVVCAGVGLVLVETISRRRRTWKRHLKTVLLVCRAPKSIRLLLTNTTGTLAGCFSEVGFRVLQAPDMTAVYNRTAHSLPDIVVVDWRFSPTVTADMEKLLAARSSMTNIPVIYYNVPDPGAIRHPTLLSTVRYLGISISDRDIFDFVTPLVITGEESRIINKSIQPSALEGEISEANMSAVLQIIEIGQKSGCLLVHYLRPYGMIYFEKGCITFAAVRQLTAQQAVYAILGLSSGHFRFISGKTPPSPNCRLRVMELLMEWTRRSDEAARG